MTSLMVEQKICQYITEVNVCYNETNKGNNKITELRTIFQRESQNS
jgi:hypothetical protein